MHKDGSTFKANGLKIIADTFCVCISKNINIQSIFKSSCFYIVFSLDLEDRSGQRGKHVTRSLALLEKLSPSPCSSHNTSMLNITIPPIEYCLEWSPKPWSPENHGGDFMYFKSIYSR